jgi:hypothetical protein
MIEIYPKAYLTLFNRVVDQESGGPKVHEKINGGRGA